MSTFAVCTALYEGARAFLPAYLAGLASAAKGEELSLVVAVDDLEAPDEVIAQLETVCPVVAVSAPEGAGPAQVRKRLLLEAVAGSADILIFTDMDDVLSADAPGKHRDNLQQADISFGDMQLIDSTGRDVERRFFDGAEIPWMLCGPDAILDRNFLGLSNTAIRRASIPDSALCVPEHIRAVDWWLFTSLLLAGRTARRIPSHVAQYRVYSTNTLGADMPATREALRNQIDMAIRHYKAFPAIAEFAIRRQRLTELADEVAGWTSHELAVALSATEAKPGVWFESLSRLCEPRSRITDVSAVA